jgi:hypothetical protein
MTVAGDTWPDVEGALRTYLRADTDLAATVGQRVYFAVPRDSKDGTFESKFPCVKITRLGGGQDPSQVPIDQALVQFDVYGKKSDEPGGGRGPTTIAMNALRKALSKAQGKTRLDPTTVTWDVDVRSVSFVSLPADDRPRFVLTVMVPCMVEPA